MTSASPPIGASRAAACVHCSLPVPAALIRGDGEPAFCCGGCATAYAIIHDGGQQFEMLGDRQQMLGDEPLRGALGRALNALDGHDGYLAKAQAAYRALSLSGELRWNSEGVVKLAGDHRLCVHADPRGSCGYLYVAAWFDTYPVDMATVVCAGDVGYEAAEVKWSHRELPPAVGDDRTFGQRVGRATIVGYRVTHGYLMALVVPYTAFCNPERYPVVGVYGCDIVADTLEDEAS